MNLSDNFKNFNYEFLKSPCYGTDDYDYQIKNQETSSSDSTTSNKNLNNEPNKKFKMNLKAFVSKMNSKKSREKTIRKSSQKILSPDYDNNAQSTAYRDLSSPHRKRPLSKISQKSLADTNATTPSKCRNNYLYFNYNNNKMNYLNEANNANVATPNINLNSNYYKLAQRLIP